MLIFNEMIDDEVRFVLDKHAELDFDSASSLKQQCADKHLESIDVYTVLPRYNAKLAYHHDFLKSRFIYAIIPSV